MTDRKFNELKKKVDIILNDWRPVLGLSNHRFNIKYLREYNKERYTVAQCFPLWQYKSHTIEIFMPAIKDCQDDSELEEDILHELCHILIAAATTNDVPYNEFERQMKEYATQNVAHALIWAKNAGRKNAKV